MKIWLDGKLQEVEAVKEPDILPPTSLEDELADIKAALAKLQNSLEPLIKKLLGG